jgi:hypothetical protein
MKNLSIFLKDKVALARRCGNCTLALVGILFLTGFEYEQMSLPIPPYQYITAPEVAGSRYVFVMLPPSGLSKGSGYCATLSDTGQLVPVWKTEGWYDYPGDVVLSKDGHMLARVNSSYNPGQTEDKIRLLTLYAAGKERHSFSFSNLFPGKTLGSYKESSAGGFLQVVEFVEVWKLRFEITGRTIATPDDERFKKLDALDQNKLLLVLVTGDNQTILLSPEEGIEMSRFAVRFNLNE